MVTSRLGEEGIGGEEIIGIGEPIDKKDRKREAAKKAWATIRLKRIERIARENRQIEFYRFNKDMRYVSYSTYRIRPPLIKPSRLTVRKKGGVGKELSDGYALNFAIGCTHACRFCYVDSIHKRFTLQRLIKQEEELGLSEGIVTTTSNVDIVTRSWGMYLLIPTAESLDDAIKQTPWHKWKGKEVMLSSTHDPYLPELAGYARRILEASLPYGVRYLIQTRSTLVKNDFDLLEKYKEQVKLQVSICTLREDIARAIEPRVPSPRARLNLLKEAKSRGLTTGIIIAPILPIEGWLEDLEQIFKEVATIAASSGSTDNASSIVDIVYGESLHIRGSNIEYIREETDIPLLLHSDRHVGRCFTALLKKYNLNGRYWYGC